MRRLVVRSMRRLICAACVVAAASSARAVAQEPETGAAPDDQAPTVHIIAPAPPTRPAALMPMYAGLIGLQAFDGYSTIHGVRAGGAEQNPLVGGLADRPVAFWTIKAMSTVTTIYFAEQLWRDNHKTQAIVLLIVANATMGVVAARNAAVLRTQ